MPRVAPVTRQMRPLMSVMLRRSLGPLGSKNQLPVADVDPAAELESDFAEVSVLAEAEPLVQRDARGIRQRDAAGDVVDVLLSQRGEQRSVELRADPAPQVIGRDVDRAFYREAVRGAALPCGRVRVTGDETVLLLDEPRPARRHVADAL